jgi:hypothetical protein
VASDQDRSRDREVIARAFESQVLFPLMAMVQRDPEGVRLLLGEFAGKFDKLYDLTPALPNPTSDPFGLNGRDDARRNPVHGRMVEVTATDASDIGRNQRAQMRELCLLEILASETRPFSLAQLMKGLETRGFDDGQPAVVSQLHRMKTGDTIEQPGIGMYAITASGLSHLRKLRSSVGALMKA